MSTIKVEKIQHPNAASVALTLDTSGYLALQAGSASTPAIQGPSDPNTGIFFPAADTIAFAEGGTEVLRIDSNGRVGVGTSSPSYQFHVSNTGASALGVFTRTSGASVYIEGGSTLGNVGTVGNHNLGFTTNSTTAMTIDTSQRVGINTTTPRASLDIGGNSVFNAGTYQSPLVAVSNGYLSIKSLASDGVSRLTLIGDSVTGDGTIDWGGNGNFNLKFTNNGSERMRINSNARVLIGTTTDPGYQLSVVGFNSYAFGVRQDVGNWTYPVGTFHSNFTTGDNYLIEFYTDASSFRGRIDYNRAAGQIRYNITSDQRLKNEVKPAGTALDKLLSVPVRSYVWAETGYKIDFGFVAQELYKVVPDAVKAGDEGEEIKDVWSVDNSKLVPILTKALQEAVKRIEQLEIEIFVIKTSTLGQ